MDVDMTKHLVIWSSLLKNVDMKIIDRLIHCCRLQNVGIRGSWITLCNGIMMHVMIIYSRECQHVRIKDLALWSSLIQDVDMTRSCITWCWPRLLQNVDMTRSYIIMDIDTQRWYLIIWLAHLSFHKKYNNILCYYEFILGPIIYSVSVLYLIYCRPSNVYGNVWRHYYILYDIKITAKKMWCCI